MENVPIFTIVTTIIIILFHLLNYLGIKPNPNNIKQFIIHRSKPIAWSFYAIIAVIISVFFLFSITVVVIGTSFNVGSLTYIILILWGLIAVWTPIVLLLKSQKINEIFLLISHILMIMVVAGFWVYNWPEIGQSIFVTFLLVIFLMLYIVSEIRRNKKQIETKQ